MRYPGIKLRQWHITYIYFKYDAATEYVFLKFFNYLFLDVMR